MKRYRVVILLAIVLAVALPAAGLAAGGDNPVKIGIMPAESVKAMIEKYQPLMDYLSRKVGRPFEVHPANSYAEIVRKMADGEVDGGVVGSIAGSQAVHRGDAVPVARPEKGGVSTYKGYLIARKDSGAKKVEDLKGKTFDANTGSAAIASFFPRKLLKDRKLDFDTFFSRKTSSPKHDTVVYKVLNREADCGAVKDTEFERLAKSDERVKNELVILAKSVSFPDRNLMFRKGAPADLVKATRQALLGMEKDPDAKPALDAAGADRFIPSPAKEYEQLGKMVLGLGTK